MLAIEDGKCSCHQIHRYSQRRSSDILDTELSLNTDYYESIDDVAILSYRANGDCFIQIFDRIEADYRIFLTSILVPPTTK